MSAAYSFVVRVATYGRAAIPQRRRAARPALIVAQRDLATNDARRLLALQRLAGNAAVASLIVQRGKGVHSPKKSKIRTSKFDDLTTRSAEIYALVKIVKGRKHVYYVGQTVQGSAKRHKQHAAKHPKRGKRMCVVLKKGTWTPLQTATWEQRFINEYASGGGFLDNLVQAIAKKKYEAYLKLGRKDICPELKKHSSWPDRV